jgi:hypothetical protein
VAKGGKRAGSGRKRKPTDLKVLEGGFRKDRHGDEPRVTGAFPQAPPHLSDGERGLWETFPKPTWIVETDVVAVNAAVSIFERILRNQRAQQTTPDAGNPLAFKYTPSADGEPNLEPKENPLITQELKLWGRLMSILASLGLTPADRAKMAAPRVDGNADDKWAGIL